MGIFLDAGYSQDAELAAFRAIDAILSQADIESEILDAEPWDYTDPADDPE